MPLGTEVGLGPGDIVLDGHPAPPTERDTAAPSLFGPLLWPPSPQARILFTRNPYCRLRRPGSARRAALVANLADNCHPSGYGRPA